MHSPLLLYEPGRKGLYRLLIPSWRLSQRLRPVVSSGTHTSRAGLPCFTSPPDFRRRYILQGQQISRHGGGRPPLFDDLPVAVQPVPLLHAVELVVYKVRAVLEMARDTVRDTMPMCACGSTCTRACARACVRACVRACMWVGGAPCRCAPRAARAAPRRRTTCGCRATISRAAEIAAGPLSARRPPRPRPG